MAHVAGLMVWVDVIPPMTVQIGGAETFSRLKGPHHCAMTEPRDLYPTCSTLEWKLGIHLSEWRAARELSYRRTGKLHPELEQAHCEGVVKLLREYLDALEGQQ